MLKEVLKTILLVRHVVQNLGNESPPALDFARFRSAPSMPAVSLFFFLESAKEAVFDGLGIIATAEVLSNMGVDDCGRRIRVDQRSDRIKNNRADTGRKHETGSG